MCEQASKIKWVVYAKPPFGGPEQVLKYLARYTHRVAISNRRLLSLVEGRVQFRMERLRRWQPYKNDDIGRGRVHSPFSAPCSALWICSHPSLWIFGQSLSQGEVGIVSQLAGCQPSCHSREHALFRQPRGHHRRAVMAAMPGLQGRPDDCHSDPLVGSPGVVVGASGRRYLMNSFRAQSRRSWPTRSNLIRATGDPYLARLFGRSLDSISGQKGGNEGLLTRSNSLPSPTCIAASPILSLMNGFQSP